MFGKNTPLTTRDFRNPDVATLTINPFYTIQGEGPYIGRPAVFVRYSGCNLTCKFCDTNFEKRLDFKVDELVTNIVNMLASIDGVCNLVVITGGEPFIHASLNNLVNGLVNQRINVQIETAGTVYRDLDEICDVTIVCSPKTYIHSKMNEIVDCYKFVVSTKTTNVNENMGLPTSIEQGNKKINLKPDILKYIKYRDKHEIYISPMDEYDTKLNKYNLRLVGGICKKYGYTANAQMHKYLELD